MILFLLYGFWRNAHDQYANPLARPLLIALQVVRTLFGFHLRECTGSSSPPPPWFSHPRGTWFLSKLQALQYNYNPRGGLIEDFRYVFPGVVAFPRPFFFAVVFVNFFPDNLASEREKKKKYHTYLRQRPINLPRFSTNPEECFSLNEIWLLFWLLVRKGFCRSVFPLFYYFFFKRTSFEV